MSLSHIYSESGLRGSVCTCVPWGATAGKAMGPTCGTICSGALQSTMHRPTPAEYISSKLKKRSRIIGRVRRA